MRSLSQALMLNGRSSPNPIPSFTPIDGDPVGYASFPTPLPNLPHAQMRVRNHTAVISFSRMDTAKDYRIYILPTHPADMSFDPSGKMKIKNAIYRCAGSRGAPTQAHSEDAHTWMKTRPEVYSISNYLRTAGSSNLGYIYSTAGLDRIPVYVLGNPSQKSDIECDNAGPIRFQASRVKTYTTSSAVRAQLISARYRDDGILGYAPIDGNTLAKHPIYSGISASSENNSIVLSAKNSAEINAFSANGLTPLFSALDTADDGALPLKRVYTTNGCGDSHDELTVGLSDYNYVMDQGDQPVNEVMWPGISEKTTLVVEALDEGCPYLGHLTPNPNVANGTSQNASWYSMDELRARTLNQELFINGQFDKSNQPNAIARTLVTVSPQALAPMDWSLDFSSADTTQILSDVTQAICNILPSGTCFQMSFFRARDIEVEGITMESNSHAFGTVLGELWATYSDWAYDTNGKFRITPIQKAAFSSSGFVHASMEAGIITTGRRYPQMIISDQSYPVSESMVNGNALVVQTIGSSPYVLQVQVCNKQHWDVNNQCPYYSLERLPIAGQPFAANDGTGVLISAPYQWAPIPTLVENEGLDRRSVFDVYANTSRVYVFFEGRPYGCVNLPRTGFGVPAVGPVSISYGDVLYHSGASDSVPDGAFSGGPAGLQFQTERHFGNLGFSSGVLKPTWDESILPCFNPGVIHTTSDTGGHVNGTMADILGS